MISSTQEITPKEIYTATKLQKATVLDVTQKLFFATLATLATFWGPFVITSIATSYRYMMESTLL